MDLSKAFDCLNHELLLAELNAMALVPMLYEWCVAI